MVVNNQIRAATWPKESQDMKTSNYHSIVTYFN